MDVSYGWLLVLAIVAAVVVVVRRVISDVTHAPTRPRPAAPPILTEYPGASTPRTVWRCLPEAGSIKNLQLSREVLPHDALPLGTERDFQDALAAPSVLRVRVRHVGLNFADVFAVIGLYSATPTGPLIPGLELCGEVEGVEHRGGKATSKWKEGQQVMCVTRFGAYASVVNVDERCARPLPSGWSSAEGAACCCQGLTAYYGLKELGGLRSGGEQVVLVHSAAGGVGLYCVRIVQAMGGIVIATVGSEAKVPWLMQHTGLSRDAIIVRGTSQQYEQRLHVALTALGVGGIDISMDSLLGAYFDVTYRRLRPTGRVVVFGAGAMTSPGDSPSWLRLAWAWLRRPRLDPLEMITDNKAVLGFNLIWLYDNVQQCGELLDELIALDLPPPLVGHEYALSDAPEALRHFQRGSTTGKVVLRVPSDEAVHDA